MASLLTHALLGATLGHTAKPKEVKSRAFWALAAFCSMIPDIDVIGFRMGIPYGALWGHRGLAHSLLFAAIMALPAAFFSSRELRLRWKPALLLFGITASHGVLDAMTNGGLGVAFFSPVITKRYFLPWRPIAVSPIGIRRLTLAHGIHILWTEAVSVWVPVMILAGGIWLLRKRGMSRSWQCPEYGVED